MDNHNVRPPLGCRECAGRNTTRPDDPALGRAQPRICGPGESTRQMRKMLRGFLWSICGPFLVGAMALMCKSGRGRNRWEAEMICEACHGQQIYPPCPECGGCGIAHCCDGLVECPPVGKSTSAAKQSSEPVSAGEHQAQLESVPFSSAVTLPA